MAANPHGVASVQQRHQNGALRPSACSSKTQRTRCETRRTHVTRHAPDLLRLIFAVLVCVMVLTGLTTKARPQTAVQWTLVWAVITFLAWALLGFAWVRALALINRSNF